MIFTSFEFILFFAAVATVSACLRGFKGEKWFLLLASLAFYMSWSVPCVALIIFTSLVDFSIARKLSQLTDPIRRQRLLLASLVISLGLLGFFKYASFFAETFHAVLGVAGWRLNPTNFRIILPPAISFYTFASMGYVLDVYYERIPACQSVRDYALFTTFFPKLLSGPITKGAEVLPQFQKRERATAEDLEIGLAYILIGAVKKMVIADQIGPHINLIFASPTRFDGPTLLLGLLGYTVQLYCDFSGYADIAIGSARILGFRLPENFQMPLSALSITEFWRRWHMTLSRWFRDYVFLPLEIATRANPHPTLRVTFNIVIMMLLVGLWHGPSWNYVIFGGIHGLALAAHKVWTVWGPVSTIKKHPALRLAWAVCAWGLTLGVVLLGFVFFRTASFLEGSTFLHRLLTWNPSGTTLNSPFIPVAITGMILVHLLVRKDRNPAEELPQMSMPQRIVSYTGLVLLLVLFGATNSAPFIYFQF